MQTRKAQRTHVPSHVLSLTSVVFLKLLYDQNPLAFDHWIKGQNGIIS